MQTIGPAKLPDSLFARDPGDSLGRSIEGRYAPVFVDGEHAIGNAVEDDVLFSVRVEVRTTSNDCHTIHFARALSGPAASGVSARGRPQEKGPIRQVNQPKHVVSVAQPLARGKPVPKAIDFGIAKVTNQRLTEKTLFTRYAHIIGTPAYMSPEQAEMSGVGIDAMIQSGRRVRPYDRSCIFAGKHRNDPCLPKSPRTSGTNGHCP